MREIDNFYVALDDQGAPTSLVLAEGNYMALLADMPEQYKQTTFVKIAHAKPELAPNQNARWTGWSQKEDGSITYDWEVENYTQEQCLDMWIRNQRSYRLASCDWTQTADAPLSTEQKAAWATYRQALRDMTSVYADVTDPATIVWPLYPGEPAFEEPSAE
jgi:hypothetical protein